MRYRTIFKRCFHYPKRYWYLNLKMIPSYIRSKLFLLRHDYDPMMLNDFALWFQDIMPEILKHYRDNKHGYPILVDNWPDVDEESNPNGKAVISKNAELYKAHISRLISYLEKMDEEHEIYGTHYFMTHPKKIDKEIDKYKDKFFSELSFMFFYLWD